MMGMSILLYIERMCDKLLHILHTIAGWFVGVILFLADFIGGHELAVGLVVFVTLMDAVWGITVSIQKKRFALSELARLTIGKLAVYGCALLTFIGLDKMIGMTLSASIISTAICLVELWSASASMIILFPNFFFLKLFKKALTGEIASKLKIPEEEVDAVLNGNDKG